MVLVCAGRTGRKVPAMACTLLAAALPPALDLPRRAVKARVLHKRQRRERPRPIHPATLNAQTLNGILSCLQGGAREGPVRPSHADARLPARHHPPTPTPTPSPRTNIPQQVRTHLQT